MDERNAHLAKQSFNKYRQLEDAVVLLHWIIEDLMAIKKKLEPNNHDLKNQLTNKITILFQVLGKLDEINIDLLSAK